MDQTLLKEIVDSRDYEKMTHFGEHPMPGKYVITGPQAGGFRGWQLYVGYVVQVRKLAGEFGSDIVLIRHPDGTLGRHENQSFHSMDDFWIEKLKSLFVEGVSFDLEYKEAYTLGGKYPEIGGIVEPNDNGPVPKNSPMCMITVSNADGSKTIEAC